MNILMYWTQVSISAAYDRFAAPGLYNFLREKEDEKRKDVFEDTCYLHNICM